MNSMWYGLTILWTYMTVNSFRNYNPDTILGQKNINKAHINITWKIYWTLNTENAFPVSSITKRISISSSAFQVKRVRVLLPNSAIQSIFHLSHPNWIILSNRIYDIISNVLWNFDEWLLVVWQAIINSSLSYPKSRNSLEMASTWDSKLLSKWLHPHTWALDSVNNVKFTTLPESII